MVRPSKCATIRIYPSQRTQKTNPYRCLKCRSGRSGSAILQDRLQEQSTPHRLRQHLSGCLHQQTGQHKISRTLWSNVKNSQMVPSKQCHIHSKTCTRLTQHDGKWSLQEEPDPINRVVPVSTKLQKNFQTLGESPGEPFNNQPEEETSSLCLSNSRPSGLGSRCPQHPMGKPGCLRFSSHHSAAQCCTKTSITNVQDNSDCPDLTTKLSFWDLVEMSLDIPRQLQPIQTLLKQPLNNHYHTNV